MSQNRWRPGLVLVVSTLTILAACTDLLTGPRRRPARPLNPTSGITKDVIDVPDLTVIPLTPIDSVTGGSNTSASLAITSRTVFHVTATGVVRWEPRYVTTPPLSSGTLYPGGRVNILAGSVVTIPASPDSTAQFYWDATPRTVTGIDRPGAAQQSIAGTAQLSDGSWLYCGINYGNWCWRYVGDAGIVTFRRLQAGLSFTADSTIVNTGSTVRFTIRATPDSVEGQQLPVIVDSTRWIQDPDSAGGQWDDSSAVNACGFPGTYPITCTRLIKGPGTMFVVTHINGKRFAAQQHISIRDGRPVITASRTYVKRNDPVTFSVAMSDGSSFNFQGWNWVADSGQAQTPSCNPNWLNPCSNLPIKESGFMRTTVIHNGQAKKTRVHVTVYTTFSLDADKSVAYVGDTVTFVPKADGKVAKAARWRWIAAGSQSPDCPASNSCKRVLTQIGSDTMWAYLEPTSGQGDSASKTVTVLPPPRLQLAASPTVATLGQSVSFTASAEGAPFSVQRWAYNDQQVNACGASPQCSFAPPATGVMWVWGTVRGSPDSASVAVTIKLADDDTTSIGSDTTAILRIRATPGVVTSPMKGTYVYKKGASVVYQFGPGVGYLEMATFLDSTLTGNGGSVVLSRDRLLDVAADPDYASWPHIAELRSRLRAVLNAPNKPAAFAAHLVWYADTAGALFATRAALDSALELADYLEFDLVNDASQLIAFDEALASYVFQVRHLAGQTSVTAVSAGDRAPILARISGLNAARPHTSSTSSATNSTVFTFVNGIRTLQGGLLSTGRLVDVLVQEMLVSDAVADVYWNANLRGEIQAFADAHLGCAGQGLRHLKFRQKLTAIVRIGICKGIALIAYTILDDIVQSAFDFMNLHWGLANPLSSDVNNVKDLIRWYHLMGSSVVFVPHSQANMIIGQAAGALGGEGYALEAGHCTAALSLASPIEKQYFHLDSLLVRGMTMDEDLLQVLGLYSDFLPRYPSQVALVARDSLAATPFLLLPLARVLWGVKAHDVDRNYFLDASNRPIVRQFMQQLYDACHALP